MRNGSVERIYGDVAVFNTPPFVPYFIHLYKTTLNKFVVIAGTSSVYVDDGFSQTDITGTAPTGSAVDRWTGGTLNGVLVLNNGVDKPMYWAGDTTLNLATLPGWVANWKCSAIRPFKNYLIGLNWIKGTSYYPNMVKWSAAADPGTVPATWDEADPTNDAGETDLSETSGTVVDGLPLGDTFIIYKTDSMYAMTYIGGQYIWQFRRLPGEVGILARGCVCNTPQGHLVLTVGDLVLHNGGEPRSILSGSMRQWLVDNLDIDNYARSFLVSNPATNEAWICFPETGSTTCSRAIIWNWIDNTFSLRDLNQVTYGLSGQYEYASSDPYDSDVGSYDSDTTVYDVTDIPLTKTRFLMCNANQDLLGFDIGTDFNGTAFSASIERTGLSFDAPDTVKMIRGIYPRIVGQTGATVYIQGGGAMDTEGSYSWSDPVPYVIGTTYRADMFASGRFLAYRIYSTANFNWRIKSIDVDVVSMGTY